MDTLVKYQKINGQKINKEKSVEYLHHYVSQTLSARSFGYIEDWLSEWYARASSASGASHTPQFGVEAESTLQGLRYMESTHIPQLIVETDSILMKNIMERRWHNPWKIINIVEEI
ncbi:hypothetical protein RND71_025060 [Anisodus tanguticus]|uniref:Uncharacterized protein n=1 Tax=Anisodus tanguticus TaxID=243964 RepID=A0AAE1RRS5_9SOLA|nr:hypothetical protein RND71_025060 [Anisodus tanguticus]